MDCVSLETLARRAENVNDWQEAARLWRLAGRYEDAECCQMIVDATALGDAYRTRLLKVAGPEPEVCGPKEDSIKWMTWFKVMSKIYKEYYKEYYK